MNPLRLGAFAILVLATAPVEAAPAACVAGTAAGHACHRIDFVARLELNQLGYNELNDVWGWTDTTTGREYALVGATRGTVFVDITDAANPRIVGRLPAHEEIIAAAGSSKRSSADKMCKSSGTGGTSGGGAQPMHEDGCGEGASAWRNIKVYRDHAYVGSEAAGHGLQVFDLTQLRAFPPGSPVQIFDETSRYAGFGNSHTLDIDEASGFLYAVGSNTYSGGPHILSLADPANPVAVGGYAADGYSHEILCRVYAGPDTRYTGRQICLGSNTDTLTILDVTDKSNIVQVSRTGYPGVGYTHQGWTSADQRYIFMNDELDEVQQDIRTRTLVWDLADLRAPVLIDQIHQPRFVIDHNNFVHGGFVYQSDYTAGLVVFDGRDPRHAFEVGFFDTFPASDARVFDGTWSNYPFFASGVVAVSDISQGLFLLRPQFGGTLSDAKVTLTMGGGAIGGEPGGLLTPGVAGGTVTFSVGSGVRFSVVTDIGAGNTCVDSADGRVLRCRLNSATPVTYSVAVVATGKFPVQTELVAMVAGGGDESAPIDNRVQLTVTAPASGGGGGGGGGGALDLALLVLMVGAGMGRPRRTLAR